MNAILKYPGAKNRIADWIVSYMPKHDVYLELFGGSMAVLLNKGRSHIETVNDIDGEIVNFFLVLRDHPEELKRSIELTPFARDEYKNAFEETEDPVNCYNENWCECHHPLVNPSKVQISCGCIVKMWNDVGMEG